MEVTKRVLLTVGQPRPSGEREVAIGPMGEVLEEVLEEEEKEDGEEGDVEEEEALVVGYGGAEEVMLSA